MNFGYSQSLNLKMLEQITNISFWDIDEVMMNGYGFEKFKEDEERMKHYVKIKDNNFDNVLMISVINYKDYSCHWLDIRVAKNYSLRKIKDDLVDLGFLYGGNNEYGFSIYNKDEVTYVIANEPNDVGATQILVMCEQ